MKVWCDIANPVLGTPSNSKQGMEMVGAQQEVGEGLNTNKEFGLSCGQWGATEEFK